jgi:ATP-dependent Clp protease ATP-binding subunit ClpB
MTAIVDIQLKRLEKMLADRHVTLKLDKAAMAWLAAAGYDPVYGARPLKRLIQRVLQNPIASLILEGKIADGDAIKVTADDEGLVINGKRAEAA